MSRRTRELEELHAVLITRCAGQRDEIARLAATIQAGTARVDHELLRLKRWAVHPALIATAVALVSVLVGSRPLRAIGAMLALMLPILRVTAAGRRIQREVDDVR